jgi:hypothetical protein
MVLLSCCLCLSPFEACSPSKKVRRRKGTERVSEQHSHGVFSAEAEGVENSGEGGGDKGEARLLRDCPGPLQHLEHFRGRARGLNILQ